jgi:NADPH-ferrihemoprotein reductase
VTALDPQYMTADNLAVMPENSPSVVEGVAAALKYNLDALFDIEAEKAVFPTPCTVREALTRYVDLSGIPRRSVLKALAWFARAPRQADRLRFLASKEGRGEYRTFVEEQGLSLFHLVTEEFRSLAIPLEHFINLAPHLQPRYYTISSSSSAHPDSIHVTVAVTQATLRSGRVHTGVCSSYMALPGIQTLRIFVRPSSFRLPSDASTPVILVGPGTGIAPMRAILYERRHQRTVGRKAVGETVLFFGCRRRDTDFLYEEELMGFAGDGTLTRLELAFSREQNSKVYVQHRIVEADVARVLWDLVHKKGAYVYVCGGTQMGHDVLKAFEQVAEVQGRLAPSTAVEYIRSLQSDARYVQELWSA